jgi:hypothetical protein
MRDAGSSTALLWLSLVGEHHCHPGDHDLTISLLRRDCRGVYNHGIIEGMTGGGIFLTILASPLLLFS